VAKGQSLTWADVAIDPASRAHALRREMEQLFTPAPRSVTAALRQAATMR